MEPKLNGLSPRCLRRNHRAGRETVQGTAGQGGDDVRAADGEDQVGVSVYAVRGRIILDWAVPFFSSLFN